MWVRHKCKICKGTGKIGRHNCDCLVLPDYMKLFPDAQWQDTYIRLNTPAKVLVYACCDDGCLLINDWSDVIITGVGQLRERMTPRTLEELNNLCGALRLRVCI